MLDQNLIAAKAVEAGSRLTVKSALNPVLWLCAIITVPSFISFGFNPNPPTWWIVLAMTPVATAVFGFIFLLFCDRDKLQSEEYQLKKQSLELVQEMGEKNPKAISMEDLDSIAEPSQASLKASNNLEQEDNR